MRAWIVLFLLVLGILFPMHWIGQFSAGYKQAFDRIFGPEWMHVAMHSALYAALGAMLVVVTRPPMRWPILWLISISVLGVGILQELFQWLTQTKTLSTTVVLRGSIFDLGVDWLGSLLGIASLYLIKRKFDRLHPVDKNR